MCTGQKKLVLCSLQFVSLMFSVIALFISIRGQGPEVRGQGDGLVAKVLANTYEDKQDGTCL